MKLKAGKPGKPGELGEPGEPGQVTTKLTVFQIPSFLQSTSGRLIGWLVGRFCLQNSPIHTQYAKLMPRPAKVCQLCKHVTKITKNM